MIRCSLSLAAVLTLGRVQLVAEPSLAKDCTIHFTTQEQGKSRLAKRDLYIKGMSPFERAAKIKKSGPISTEDYIEFIQEQVLEWSDADRKKLLKIIQVAKPKLALYSKHFPRKIYLIKTTGNDEGGAPYTRGTSIILPRRSVDQSASGLERLLYHELFHILSRSNPSLRDELYTIIGYKKCGAVSLPKPMMPRRISNPDAPVVEHCIRISKEDQPFWCAPVLFSRTPKYDPNVGDTFFRYLEFRLMAIDRKSAKAILKDGQPILFKPDEVEEFFEQIGRNTNYIIHPEETLANNFVHLMSEKKSLANPEIPKKIKKLLMKK